MKKSGRKLIMSFILITVVLMQTFTLSVMATQTNDIFEDINSYTRARIFNMTTQDLIKILETDNYLDVQEILMDDPQVDLIPGVDMPFESNMATAKAILTGGIGCIPGIGALISATTGLFIPDSIDMVEKEIKNEIYSITKNEFSQETLRMLSTNIIGILNNADRYSESMAAYLKYLEAPTNDSLDQLKNELRSSADEYLSNLEQYIPNFKKQGYEVLSLPLFTLMANLHLTLLRDLALNGEEWGYSNAKVDIYKQDLKLKIKDYRQYVQTTYIEGLNARKQDEVMTKSPNEKEVYDITPAVNTGTYRWNYMNDYKRFMRLNVLDLASLWTYYDIENYPIYVNFEQVEHIYSPIVGIGNCVGLDNFVTYDKINIYEKMHEQPVTIGYKAYDSSNLVTVMDISSTDASIYNSSHSVDYTMGMDLQSTGVIRDIDTVSVYTGSIPGENEAVSYVVPMAYGINGTGIGVKPNDGSTWDFSYDGYRVWRIHNFDDSVKPEGLNHSILGVVFEFRPKFSNYENVVFDDRISVIPAEKYFSSAFKQREEVMLGGDSMHAQYLVYKINSPVKGDFQLRYRACYKDDRPISTYIYNYDTNTYEKVAETTLTVSTSGFVTDNGTYDLYDVATVRLKKGENLISILGNTVLSSIEFKPITIYEDETLVYDYIQTKDPAIIEEPINVDLYTDTNYQGSGLFKDFYGEIVNFSSIYNYGLKSIRVDGDYTVTGFDNAYYYGTPHTFTNSNPYLDSNYNIQSLRIVKGGHEGVYLYSEKNYGGTETKVSFDCKNTGVMGIPNDTVSSIKIVGDYVVKAYEDEHYVGKYSYLQASDPDLSNNVIGDNQVSSIKINKVDPTKLQEGVFIYKDTGYLGEWVRLVSGDYYSWNGFGLDNDTISSIKIIGDYQVEVFDDINFGGKSQVFKASDDSLEDDFIGDNSISSLKIRTVAP